MRDDRDIPSVLQHGLLHSRGTAEAPGQIWGSTHPADDRSVSMAADDHVIVRNRDIKPEDIVHVDRSYPVTGATGAPRRLSHYRTGKYAKYHHADFLKDHGLSSKSGYDLQAEDLKRAT